ncbi:MAG: hypothetical protein KDC88_11630, partial [Ignavibacteriae bacterium]|nr:hypothetical protein [Ignavibacteriota bacterium]
MTLKSLCFLLIILFFGIGCSSGNGTDPIELVQQSTDSDGEIVLENVKNVSIENIKGGVILYSNDIESNKINYVLSKTVKADS